MSWNRTWFIAFAILHLACMVLSSCSIDVQATLPFVLEYALWRGWQQSLIYTPLMEPDCRWALLRLMKCLSVNGVGVAAPTLAEPRVRLRMGVVILAPRFVGNTTEIVTKAMKEFSKLDMNTGAYDWLIACRSKKDVENINNILNATSIRFDQTIVAAYPKSKLHLTPLCESNFIYQRDAINEKHSSRRDYIRSYAHAHRNKWDFNNENSPSGRDQNYYKTSVRFKNLTKRRNYVKAGSLLPLFQSGILFYNYSRTFEMTNISRFRIDERSDRTARWRNSYRRRVSPGTDHGISVVQYFKVRPNSTLYAHLLGTWTPEDSMSSVESPYPVEARSFLGEELKVGRCNSSGEADLALDDDGPTAPDLLDDVMVFLTVQFNATVSSRYFSKLGFRTYEGSWTGLLGALVDGSIDVALEPVTAHATRHRDMDFIFPIAETMCNIYIRHQETSTVRDIFLAPFSVRLLLCVLAVAVVAAILVVIVSKLAPRPGAERRPVDFAEALLWSTGILCQQGGTWTPSSPAASTLLIVCLLFAVITYNSYAAFITSVLSVRVASLDTVAAVLHSSNFKIGYIKNGADQMYLMSTRDAQLNAFYIRGYSNAENLVTSVEEGLSRAASEDYAFFADQRIARTKLRALSQARGRCSLRELPIPSTRAHLAFPLPHRSPYAKPTLLSLLSLRSGGSLALLSAALVPVMPDCKPPPGFASARATDVRSALILLALGLIAAFMIGISEYCWKNRNELRNYVSEKIYNRIIHLVH